jgi:hypothetical protein
VIVPTPQRFLGRDQPADVAAVRSIPRVLFIAVPESKTGKNRIHFDLEPANGTRDDELARLISLGACTVQDLRQQNGTGWVVLADPEGQRVLGMVISLAVTATVAMRIR